MMLYVKYGMVRIGFMASEEIFENVDGRWRDAYFWYYKLTYMPLAQVS